MKKSKFITDFRDIPTPREKMPHLPLEGRNGFVEVELGFEEDRAIREAKRCLSCRRCIGCGLCLAECDPRAVVYDQEARTLNLKVGAIVLAPGFDGFDAGRIRELGYREFANVITSIELERMLSESGPYGGRVLRPYDGDVPARIAFVQCVGSRSEALGADYCSSVCCTSAMRESLALVDGITDAGVTIFHRDMRPVGKGAEEFYQALLKEPRVSLIRAVVSRVEEIPESGNLIVEFSRAVSGKATGSPTDSAAAKGTGSGVASSASSETSGTTREEFDLVVLSVGIRPSSTARVISRATGVRLNKYGFCRTDALAPVATGKAGIVAAGAFTGPQNIAQSVCQADAAAAVALRSIIPVASSSSVLVIGGGVAGLTAAVELSNSGHEVTIIEREREVGGIVAGFPVRPEVTPEKSALGETLIPSLLKTLEATKKVRILTSTELVRFSGEVGHFSAALRSDGKEIEANFGAVVICTGGKEYVPDRTLYGKGRRIVTQFEFEDALNAGKLDASSVAMIQCVGSRSFDWPVCSRTCCEQALRSALRVKQLKPETPVTVFHRDIRVYFVEEELFSEAREKGIEFVRVSDDASAGAMSGVATGSVGEPAPAGAASADCVVLSTGFRPHSGAAELARLLGVEVDDKGFFAAAHPDLRPVDSSRHGIYICGLAHSPQNISETITQAMAAARKASAAVRRVAA